MRYGWLVYPIQALTMLAYPLASPAQRTTATLLNAVVGCVPLVLPELLGKLSDWGVFELNVLSAGLATIQLIQVHLMQGSLGYVFVGLRVQTVGGSRPNFRNTLLRALPFLIALMIIMMMKQPGGASYSGPLTPVLAFVYAFLAASAVFLLVNGRRSLLDVLSGTMVVKVHSVGK